MAYSWKLSDIIALVKCEVHNKKKAKDSFSISQNLILKKMPHLAQILRMTTKFELDLYLIMFYSLVNFE